MTTHNTFSKDDTLLVKGLAIIMMFAHHCFLDPTRYEGYTVIFAPFSEGRINSITFSFKVCVAMFVFLTGYGITCSYKKISPTYDIDAQTTVRTITRRLVSLIGGFVVIHVLAQLWDVLIVRDGRFAYVYGEGILAIYNCLIDMLGLAELLHTPTYLATFWYMSLAILLVFAVPVLLQVNRRFGMAPMLFFTVLFRCFFVPENANHMAYLPNYLPCLAVGICAADRNLIVRLAKKKVTGNNLADGIINFVVMAAICLVVMIIRQQKQYTPTMVICDAVVPLLLCVMVFLVSGMPIVTPVLRILGKYSMNMFLIHNFIRVVWYMDFTYSFKYWWLILLVLLGISLALSILIERFKELIHYPSLLKALCRRLEGQPQG